MAALAFDPHFELLTLMLSWSLVGARLSSMLGWGRGRTHKAGSRETRGCQVASHGVNVPLRATCTFPEAKTEDATKTPDPLLPRPLV